MFRPISRRTMLRGCGAALALPLMEAMVPKAKADQRLAKPPLRTAYFFMPNGVHTQRWRPEGNEEKFELSPSLQPFKGIKDKIILLENLTNQRTAGRNGHWPKVPAWLHGGFVKRNAGSDIDVGGVSADQVMADAIGNQTPLPSFELGFEPTRSGVDNAGGGFAMLYGSHLSWRDPHTPVPKEIVPQLAFDRLFRTASAGPVVSGFNPNQKAVTDALQRDDLSVLDAVSEDAWLIKGKISSADRVKLDEYMESVRAVEKRLENTLKPQKRWINAGRFDLPRPGPGIPKDHREHMRQMLDILALAFWTDSTRISTFMIGDAQSGMRFPWLDGVTNYWHGISHHENDPNTLVQYSKIVDWNIAQFAGFCHRLDALKEGEGSVLDNSQLLFGCSIRDGNKHDIDDLPLLLAGGGAGTIRSGRRLISPKKTPMCNLHRALMERMGVKKDTFGDSTGVLQLA
ncbi:MAG: hypothetical protein RLZ85_1256 [Verrucomicrobiota bacterium]|jgi:hypothetical protein